MTAYQSKPITVQALQYQAPDTDTEGNVAEMVKFADGVTRQSPWDPANGQNCLLILADGAELPAGVITPGDYLVKGPDGLYAATAQDFEATYSQKATRQR